MKNSIKKILKWTPTLAVSLMVITGASLSLMGNEQMVAASSKMGMLRYMDLLSSAEILFVLMFLYPQTMKFGCFFLTAYFGGAIAAEISHGNDFIAPAIILCLVWLGAYLREPSLFKPGFPESTVLPAA